jgi:hypothetical protein
VSETAEVRQDHLDRWACDLCTVTLGTSAGESAVLEMARRHLNEKHPKWEHIGGLAKIDFLKGGVREASS